MAFARCGNRGSRAGGGLIVLGRELAHRRLAIEQIDQLLPGQGLVFEQALKMCNSSIFSSMMRRAFA